MWRYAWCTNNPNNFGDHSTILLIYHLLNALTLNVVHIALRLFCDSLIFQLLRFVLVTMCFCFFFCFLQRDFDSSCLLCLFCLYLCVCVQITADLLWFVFNLSLILCLDLCCSVWIHIMNLMSHINTGTSGTNTPLRHVVFTLHKGILLTTQLNGKSEF